MEAIFSSSSLWFNLTNPVELEKLIKRHFVKNSIHSDSTELIFMLMYITIGCLGITINSIVIFVILTSKRLRNLENSLILNLCLADILLCLWSIPFTLYQVLRRDWALGQLMCSTVPFLQATIVFVIAQTITVIAFDRLSVITGQHSLKRKHHWSNRMSNHSECPITKRIPLIWISSLILGSPLIYFYKEVNFNYNGIPLYNRCIEDWSAEVRIIYSTITFTVSLVIPIVCLIASQVQIVTFLKKQGNHDLKPALITRSTISSTGLHSTSVILPEETVKDEQQVNLNINSKPSKPKDNNETDSDTNEKIGNNETQDKVNSPKSCPIDGNNTEPDKINNSVNNVDNKNNGLLISSLKKPLARYTVTLKPVRFTLAKGVRNRRAIVSLYRVSVTFILSWLPLNIVNLYLDLIDQPSITGTKVYLILGICHLIAISSSVTNAIFYGLMNTNIRRELSKIRLTFNHNNNSQSHQTSTPMPSHVI
ncbi:neuropeptide Y receptor type 6-like [Tetranychus urticae]|uniref:G-protein coupled receptors family 1 profile domain-containing protein n=1 Tax=Tetranychus urticae TaxID=32264 RepID=T1L280_TETUR|nr:neuropeptide Y receptor type 6-like [Tetranychus urticae]